MGWKTVLKYIGVWFLGGVLGSGIDNVVFPESTIYSPFSLIFSISGVIIYYVVRNDIWEENKWKAGSIIGVGILFSFLFATFTLGWMSQVAPETNSKIYAFQDNKTQFKTTEFIYQPPEGYTKDKEQEDIRKGIVQFVSGSNSITLRTGPINYSKTVYYQNASWEDKVQRMEQRGYTFLQEPRVERIGGKRFWHLKFEKTVTGRTYTADMYTTYNDNRQLLIIFSVPSSDTAELENLQDSLSEVQFK